MKAINVRAVRVGIVLVAVMLGVSACVQTDRSVVTPDVQVFEPDLLGDWKSGTAASDRLTLAKHADGKSYAVTTYDRDGTPQPGHVVLRVMKLGDDRFYELEVRDDKETRYAVGRLTFDKEKITGWTFDKDDDAFNAPDAKTAEVPDGPAEKQKVLAMEPAKVQAFLKAHAKEMTKRAMTVERAVAAPPASTK